MARTQDGATVTIELHHELMVRTPFVEPRGYDDLLRRSQPFEWGGMSYQTLGREDMLWHVYAHAFVIYTLRLGAIRLLSVADLVHATEAWIDRIDWARLRRDYGACCERCTCFTIWCRGRRTSRRCCANRWHVRRAPSVPIRSIRILIGPCAIPDVLWPPEWWFRMRYGITSWPRWVWFRAVGHPAHLALPAASAVLRRILGWFGLRRMDAGQA